MQPAAELARFETALRREARLFARRLAATEEGPVLGLSPRLLLARLAPDLGPEEAAHPGRLAAGRRRDIADRLRLEEARLCRLARAADPRYDLNRHIGIRRLAARLAAAEPEAPAAPPSGRELNGRFRSPRARRPAQAATLAGSAATRPAVR